MALAPEITTLLNQIEQRLSAPGPVLLEGADLCDRLRALVGRVGDTVLARNLVFATDDGLSCTLTVASGRLMRISTMTPEGHHVIRAEPGADREEQLLVLGEALAGLAALESPLTLTTRALAEEVSADDVGQSAADLSRFCEAHEWFRDFGAAEAEVDVAKNDAGTAQCVIAADGSVSDPGGLGLSAGAAAALMRERAAWPQELSALAGEGTALLLMAGEDRRSLSIGFGPGRLVVRRAEPGATGDLWRAWREEDGA